MFEPFFTTKPVGEGSGLGLAMVHGFVKQSGGHVRIYSEERRRHDREDLPAAHDRRPRRQSRHRPASPNRRHRSPRAKPQETILLVEDNEDVRHYAKDVLEDLGYRVLDAADAHEALRLVAEKPQIDLLFTDVVLPGSDTGRDARRPAALSATRSCRCFTPPATRATPSSIRDGSTPTCSS